MSSGPELQGPKLPTHSYRIPILKHVNVDSSKTKTDPELMERSLPEMHQDKSVSVFIKL